MIFFPKSSAFKHGKIAYFETIFLNFYQTHLQRDDLNFIASFAYLKPSVKSGAVSEI